MVIKLKPKGISLLEKHLVEAFVENPEEVCRNAEVAGLNLNSLLQKYLRRHFEIEEDLLRIRSGEKPKYNPLEYYRSK